MRLSFRLIPDDRLKKFLNNKCSRVNFKEFKSYLIDQNSEVNGGQDINAELSSVQK